MDAKLKDKILGQALIYYYTQVTTKDIEDTITAIEFTKVAISVINSIHVNEIISMRDEL